MPQSRPSERRPAPVHLLSDPPSIEIILERMTTPDRTHQPLSAHRQQELQAGQPPTRQESFEALCTFIVTAQGPDWIGGKYAGALSRIDLLNMAWGLTMWPRTTDPDSTTYIFNWTNALLREVMDVVLFAWHPRIQPVTTRVSSLARLVHHADVFAISGAKAVAMAIKNDTEEKRFAKQSNQAMVVHWCRCVAWADNKADQEILNVLGRDPPKSAKDMLELFYRPKVMMQGLEGFANEVLAAIANEQHLLG